MMLASQDAIVIGAGVAGLSVALYLQRNGVKVAVIDALPPASGASFGNAGLLSPDTAAPIAMPGMLAKVPGWLRDPNGPLVMRPAYFAKAFPWLMKWIAAGRLDRVMQISDAMRALHRDTLGCWQELLGGPLYRELVRPSGQVQLWEGEVETASAVVERKVRERHGLPSQLLNADDLRQMFPGIARSITRGMLIPGNAHTRNPARMVQGLADQFRAGGGDIIAERVMKLIPQEGGGFMVMTNIANRLARQVALAAGAWSQRLLAPLGVRVQLETERGYHAMLFTPGIEPAFPISYKTRGFAITPMEDGLRIAGTVEFAGLDPAPDETRARLLVDHAKRLFPNLQTENVRYWMGHRPSTPDSLPFLGPVRGHPGLFLAFGHGHFGMTGGPTGGKLVASMIMGVPTGIDTTPFRPDRF